MNTVQEDPRLTKVMVNSYKNLEDVSIETKKVYVPLIRVRSKIFSEKIVSLPFMDIGGIFGNLKGGDIFDLISSPTTKKINIKLNEFDKDLAKKSSFLKGEGFVEIYKKCQFYISLEDPKMKWAKFHKHTRNDIRKAEKSGLKIVNMNSPIEIKKFYRLYFNQMKDFGTPPHSLKFFLNLFVEFGEDFYGLNCYRQNNLIASTLVIKAKNVSFLWFNISNPNYRGFRPNDLLYWENIKYLYRKNVKYLDVGQVDALSENPREKGLFKFKQKWLGKTYKNKHYIYTFGKGIRETQEVGNSLKKFRRIWPFLPNSLIKIIGPKITSEIGV